MHGDVGHFITQILILLGSSAVLITLFHRFGVPALLAFLLVGLAFGPTGFQIVTDVEDLRAVGELGLTFLLFVLGLEFSLPRLIALRHTVFKLGGAQVLICTLAFFIAFYWWGLSWQIALLVAGGLALSSTAIVSKELIRLGQLQTRHGQIAIGILLFQDLVAVVLLIAVPIVGGNATYNNVGDILIPVAKSIALLVGLFLAARYLLPLVLAEVARSRSDELLVLSALVIVLVAGMLTSLIGLSMELGAFLAGMMLGESRFRHQLEADVRPFRDLLLGLFFITIGMLIDTGMLKEYWFRIVASGIGLLGFKAIIIAGTARLMGESFRAALPAGLVLGQGGEFAFALLALATRDALIADDVASFLVSIVIVSMAITPLVIRYADTWAEMLAQRFSKPDETVEVSAQRLPQDSHYQDHVVILGFGRVGQTVARFLRQLHFSYLALETDTVRIAEARAAGEPVYYGDTTRKDILTLAGVEKAALLVISFDDPTQAKHILSVVKELNPGLPVLTRTRDDSSLEALIAAGSSEVVPETLEASLMLVSHVLLLLNVPIRKIHNIIDQARRDRYKLLHGFYHGERINLVDKKGEETQVLHAVPLAERAWARDKNLNELQWPCEYMPVDEIHRDRRQYSPETLPQGELKSGDVVILRGIMSVVDRCEHYLLTGHWS